MSLLLKSTTKGLPSNDAPSPLCSCRYRRRTLLRLDLPVHTGHDSPLALRWCWISRCGVDRWCHYLDHHHLANDRHLDEHGADQCPSTNDDVRSDLEHSVLIDRCGRESRPLHHDNVTKRAGNHHPRADDVDDSLNPRQPQWREWLQWFWR